MVGFKLSLNIINFLEKKIVAWYCPKVCKVTYVFLLSSLVSNGFYVFLNSDKCYFLPRSAFGGSSLPTGEFKCAPGLIAGMRGGTRIKIILETAGVWHEMAI